MTRRGPSNAASPVARAGADASPPRRPRSVTQRPQHTAARIHEPPLADNHVDERLFSFAERPRQAAMSGLRLPAARFCQALLR